MLIYRLIIQHGFIIYQPCREKIHHHPNSDITNRINTHNNILNTHLGNHLPITLLSTSSKISPIINPLPSVIILKQKYKRGIANDRVVIDLQNTKVTTHPAIKIQTGNHLQSAGFMSKIQISKVAIRAERSKKRPTPDSPNKTQKFQTKWENWQPKLIIAGRQVISRPVQTLLSRER